ncbi:MAG: hypothetical protein IPK17_30340 [Chloroflexi bacterium]|uniref:hypothetical protein n=1 Tax=Candidatus Flexifilum breve TaxID=3140694 RepID=UPI0031349336|nr:hypothetical protein [Chloroflexota bacterium]
MLTRHPGSTVVGDILSSQVLFDAVAQAGGTPIAWASGHSLVKAKMVETGALLGGEMSGTSSSAKTTTALTMRMSRRDACCNDWPPRSNRWPRSTPACRRSTARRNIARTARMKRKPA